MKRSIRWLGVAAAALILSACGSGGDAGAPPVVTPSPNVPPPNTAIAAAAANPANDTSTNSSSAFSVLQAAGVPAVTVTGAPIVRFTVFSDGQVRQGLTVADVSVAIAKLIPASNGNPARWQSYVSRIERTTGSNNVGPGPGNTPILAEALQATVDPRPAAQQNQLVYNDAGYYVYTFSTNITDPANTFGVPFEPGLTHRIAIQLTYRNAAGQTIRVNPYYDVTFNASGNSVAVTNPAQTQVISDTSACNGCHDRLALHGGGRVDVQYCVMCHNPGTTDANSGNVLTMATMTHKIHAGRLLTPENTPGAVPYIIWGFNASKNDFSEIGYPQDLRNCRVCHTEANPATPQGGLWATQTSKEACLTCHPGGAGSDFNTSHTSFALAILGPNGKPEEIPNASCAECHRVGTAISPGRVHWNQSEEHAAKYKVNIASATYDAANRKVTVSYSVTDPTRSNARWNLVTSGCTGAAPNVTCGSTTQFGNLRFYLAYPNMVGQPLSVTEFTSYNNAGNSGSFANAYLYKGTNDGTNNYTIDLPLPPDTATAVAQGTARVVGIGQIIEPALQAMSATDPRPPVVPAANTNVVAQNTYADVVLSGAMNPRRQIVSNEKCSVCHAALGTTTGSNTVDFAFHSGARHTVESCVLCHDQNRYSSTIMTNGLALSENYSFKRMIHGIHGTSKRTYPFTHGNSVIGAFNKSGILTLDGLIGASSSSSVSAPAGVLFQPWSTGTVVPAGTPLASGVENFAAEVFYPDVGLNCNNCHVNNSWQRDQSLLGSVVAKPIDAATGKAGTDPMAWMVISPKAASCTSCHDSVAAGGGVAHAVAVGNASFGNSTQAQSLGTQESCADCHAPGMPNGVDVVHGR